MAEFTAFNIIPEEDDEDTTNLREKWRKMAESGGSLSFAKILELINAQGTGTDNETKLQNLRKQLQQAYGAVAKKDEDGRPIYLTPDGKTVVYKEESWRYTDDNAEEYKDGLSKLRLMRQDSQSGEWNSNGHSDFVNKFYGFLDQHELDDNNATSEEVMAQAGVLMMLDDKAIEFFSGQKDKTELWESYVANNSHCWKNRLKKDVDDKNLPTYELFKDNHLKCTYENIGGGDLSVTVVDSKLSILTKGNEAQTIDKITASQYNALLDILQDNGNIIKIDDKTKEILQKIKVVTDDDQKNCETADGKTSLYDHLVESGATDQDPDSDETINGYDGKEEIADAEKHSASGNVSGGTSAPSSAFQEEREPMDSYQFLSSTSSKSAKDSKGRKEARGKFLAEFKKEHVDHVIKTRLGVGGFEIACWGSEEDERKDGRIDPKTGIKSKTKMFGCKFRYGPPPSATLTDGNLKKLTKTDAAAILKGLKACGALYVTIPGKDKLGSEGYKNMLLGTISGGVVPRLGDKSLSSSSQSFGKGEVGAIWEAFEKAERSDADKIEYALRLAEQLQQLDLTTQRNLYISQHGSADGFKDKNFEDLGDYPTQFLYYARFKNFTENCVTGLNRLNGVKIKEAVRGPDGQWHLTGEAKTKAEENLSNVDKICAKIAMTKIVNNIMDGKLPKLDENGDIVKDASGKIQYEAYDPLDKQKNAAQKITSVMSAYMNAERIGVLKEIDMEVERIEASKAGDKDRGNERTIPTAIQNIDDKYLPKYKYAMSYLKGFKVTVGESDIWGGSVKSKSASEEKLGYIPPATFRSSTRGTTGTGRP